MSKFWRSGSSSSSDEDNDASDSFASTDEDDDGGFDDDNHSSDDDDDDPNKLPKGVMDPNEAWEKMKATQQFLPIPQTVSTARTKDSTRIVCMSDTHGQHNEVVLPPGDILLHCGDFTKSGEIGTMKNLNEYFESADFDEVICIAGNHDMTLHPEFYEANWQEFHRAKFDVSEAARALTACTYLQDSECTTATGSLRMYGTPWSPAFYNWAFNLHRGPEIRSYWEKIPDPTDILLVHGPPLGRGDYTSSKVRAGCQDLLEEIQDRIKPRLVVFGHVHEGAGVSFDGATVYTNASSLDRSYRTSHFPIVFDVPHDTAKPVLLVEPNCTMDFHDFTVWLEQHGYDDLLVGYSTMNDDDDDAVTENVRIVGNDLFKRSNFHDILAKLQIPYPTRAHMKRTHRALAELYAESF